MNRRNFLQAIGLVAAAPAVAAKAITSPAPKRINPEWIKAASKPHWDTLPSLKFDPLAYQGDLNWHVIKDGGVWKLDENPIRYNS